MNVILSDLENKFDIKENAYNLLFETNFNNDIVEIYSDQTLFIKKSIGTDQSIGLAEHFVIKSEPKSYLLIRINKWKIKLLKKQIENYKYIYIQKSDQKYIVTLSNKPHLYY